MRKAVLWVLTFATGFGERAWLVFTIRIAGLCAQRTTSRLRQEALCELSPNWLNMVVTYAPPFIHTLDVWLVTSHAEVRSNLKWVDTILGSS
jgi:hypothetical protein